MRATGLCRSDWHASAGHDDIVFPDRQQSGFTDWGSFAGYVVLRAADANRRAALSARPASF